MGVFNTKTTLDASPALIPAMAERICQVFTDEGYEIKRDELVSGGADISVAKGNLFKAALGMKTALKITLIPLDNAVSFEAGVGIFGQQVVPTIIMWFFAWPVLITQIWGLVQQASLDDKALAAAQEVIDQHRGNNFSGTTATASTGTSTEASTGAPSAFCTVCGARITPGARFCSACGAPLG